MLKLAILISGNGSNLQAIIDAIEQGLPAKIQIVISNKSEAYGLQRANNHHILSTVLNHKDYKTREEYDQAMSEEIEKHHCDLIVLAGFMRILSEQFVDKYYGKLINIHPSLLPKYTGLDTHKRVLAAHDKQHGASVHFVSNELDAGPIIAQKKLEILENDTEQTLKDRVQQLEHKLYPEVIRLFAEDKV